MVIKFTSFGSSVTVLFTLRLAFDVSLRKATFNWQCSISRLDDSDLAFAYGDIEMATSQQMLNATSRLATSVNYGQFA